MSDPTSSTGAPGADSNESGTNPAADTTGAAGVCLPDDPTHIRVAKGEGVCLFNKSALEIIMQLPLPGIVIFVHGVNSDGEWYSETEEGLCKGLNDRLKRNDENLKYQGASAGQLSAAKYMSELTAEGFLNPKVDSDTLIDSDDTFSPVIRFRWGYKASAEELQQFGDGVYLNEQGYWGGGPFANGCTALPDLWGKGLAENMFLWVNVQHLNPTNDRTVYSCPPRPYYVLAALRLARLVESIRKKQADAPITIVCHSQGNMVGIAAAFLGDELPPVKDRAGREGRCVADSYVLCNAPYSLVESNGAESWAERGMQDEEGRSGRQTGEARVQTLAAFFDIIGQRKPLHQDAARVDRRMANEAHGYTAKLDRDAYGLNGSTYGRVTLYCNPHDQVISSSTVQGIGWRGLDAKEIAATKGAGIFTQRVFAQGFPVGKQGSYNYWTKWESGILVRTLEDKSQQFWFPESPKVKYDLGKGLESNRNLVSKGATVLFAIIPIVGTKLAGMRINALPPKGWTLPLEAPNVKEFLPMAKRFGVESAQFDQGSDAPGESRDKKRVREADDPYAGDNPIPKGGTEAAMRKGSDAAEGDSESEAGLRYEHHALLRMQAKREGLADKKDVKTQEDQLDSASDEYKTWRTKKIKMNLAGNVNTHATDHSTIMTNGMHAQKALAYDVAIGNCDILEEDLHNLRVAADWRFLNGLPDDDPNKGFLEYFKSGKLKKLLLYEWASPNHNAGASGQRDGLDGRMPKKIVNIRSFAAKVDHSGEIN